MRYFLSILLLFVTTYCYAGNVSSNLQINNNSSYALNKFSQTSNEMGKWDFPISIAPSTQESILVEYKRDFFVWTSPKNSGQVLYQVTCSNGQIENINIAFSMSRKSWLDSVYYPNLTLSKHGADCVHSVPSEKIGWQANGTVTLTLIDNNLKT